MRSRDGTKMLLEALGTPNLNSLLPAPNTLWHLGQAIPAIDPGGISWGKSGLISERGAKAPRPRETHMLGQFWVVGHMSISARKIKSVSGGSCLISQEADDWNIQDPGQFHSQVSLLL